MKPIERSKHGMFEYTRYEMDSQVLGRPAPFGVVRTTGQVRAGDIQTSIYFFHGGDSDDRQWVAGGLIDAIDEETLSKVREAKAQIVLPMIGTSSLHDRGNRAGDNYWDHFFDEVIVMAERGTQTTAGARLVSGVSMGGFAALSAYFKRPEFFGSAGALAPAVFDLNFFDSVAIGEYARRARADVNYMALLSGLIKAEFESQDDYLSSSPMALAKEVPLEALRGKTLYLNVGSEDEFGLEAGTRQLSKILFDRDVRHELVVVPGAKHDLAYAKANVAPLIRSLLGL